MPIRVKEIPGDGPRIVDTEWKSTANPVRLVIPDGRDIPVTEEMTEEELTRAVVNANFAAAAGQNEG